MTLRYSTDIVIFGGGIAGLWLLNKLVNEGYDAILLENESVGCGQTLSSQGIIHGGLKYAISGKLSGAADAIASMPQRWRECLAGESDVDLRGVNVLSQDYFMWSNSGIRSKLKTFLGSKSLRGRVEPVKSSQYPDFFAQATVSGSLYRLPDFVVETESLLNTLFTAQQNRVFSTASHTVHFANNDNSDITNIELRNDSGSVHINAQKIIFAAGKGNQLLIDTAKLNNVQSQLRPLNMVFLKAKHLPLVYVHCIDDSFSLTPRLTITSHKDTDGNTVWYLGGEIAESGVGKSKQAQIDAAKKLLISLFPWLDLDQVIWDCFNIDRAEPQVSSKSRPDDAYIVEERGVIVSWPTKLTLAPSLGDAVLKQLKDLSVEPVNHNNDISLGDTLTHPIFASAKWNT